MSNSNTQTIINKILSNFLIGNCAYFLCLIFLGFANLLSGQDMSGEWNGLLKQPEGGQMKLYYFSMNLKQEGKVITGTSKISLTTDPRVYCIMELKGTFEKDVLIFEELKINKQSIFPKKDWCIKKGKLNFTIKKDGFCVEGTWGGNLGNTICPPGMLTVCKIVPIAQIN